MLLEVVFRVRVGGLEGRVLRSRKETTNLTRDRVSYAFRL